MARAENDRTYREVIETGLGALMCLGCEVFGRWSDDAVEMIRELVTLKAQEAPPCMRGCAGAAWSHRWWALVSVGVQRAVAEALLSGSGYDLQPHPPTQAAPPLADVLAEA